MTPLLGVAGGIADYFRVDPVIVRVIFRTAGRQRGVFQTTKGGSEAERGLPAGFSFIPRG